jgi:hypothetical protein
MANLRKSNPKRHCGFAANSGKTSPNPSFGGESPSLLGRAGEGCNSGLLRSARNDGVSVRFFLFLIIPIFLHSCGNAEDENAIDDPTTIYSIIREDTSAGIDVVGGRSNPMEVRKRIFESKIPENTFEEKRKVFYTLLDTLYKLKSYEDQDIYADVDSLNYLAIHYLKNILLDKKSRIAPLKHKMLNRITSLDKNFSVYYWEENIGVAIPTTITVYQYVGTDGTLQSYFNMDNTDKEDFIFTTSKIIGIYKLSSTNGKLLYLLNFEGCTDSENCFKGSTIAEVTDKGLQFNYDSFGESVEYFFENYASGEKLTLSYNAATKILTYKLFTPDNKLEQKLFLFNGETFELKE